MKTKENPKIVILDLSPDLVNNLKIDFSGDDSELTNNIEELTTFVVRRLSFNKQKLSDALWDEFEKPTYGAVESLNDLATSCQAIHVALNSSLSDCNISTDIIKTRYVPIVLVDEGVVLLIDKDVFLKYHAPMI